MGITANLDDVGILKGVAKAGARRQIIQRRLTPFARFKIGDGDRLAGRGIVDT